MVSILNLSGNLNYSPSNKQPGFMPSRKCTILWFSITKVIVYIKSIGDIIMKSINVTVTCISLTNRFNKCVLQYNVGITTCSCFFCCLLHSCRWDLKWGHKRCRPIWFKEAYIWSILHICDKYNSKSFQENTYSWPFDIAEKLGTIQQ